MDQSETKRTPPFLKLLQADAQQACWTTRAHGVFGPGTWYKRTLCAIGHPVQRTVSLSSDVAVQGGYTQLSPFIK